MSKLRKKGQAGKGKSMSPISPKNMIKVRFANNKKRGSLGRLLSFALKHQISIEDFERMLHEEIGDPKWEKEVVATYKMRLTKED